ncbi:type IV pilus assembly protein PilY1 [Sinobacterium caligoides]|uniref:Type IV pilus assembly protein PilY1 n=2 Tax=Sinobacterium caligoides TaxID=933926 RepID=A0A3N2D4Z2_9GAMM|nr:type IV pilus assembly protein PilY1 [Sinobacterium caligoides]
MKRIYKQGLIVSALLTTQTLLAGPATLSTVPMVTSEDVRPNIMLLLDTSGSMNYSLKNGDCRHDVNARVPCRIDLAKRAAESLVDRLDFVRLGYGTFSSRHTGQGGRLRYDIADLDNQVKKDVKQAISTTRASGGTPLAESLEGLGRYFSKKNGSPQSKEFLDNLDDDTKAPKASDVIQYYCQKNFIIALTDGAPSQDDGVSKYIKNYDKTKDYSYREYYVSDATHKLYDTDFRPDITDPSDPEHINNVITYLIGFAEESVYGANTATGKMLRDAATGDPKLEEGGTRLEGKFYPTADENALDEAFKSISNDIAAKVGSSSTVSFNTSSIQNGSEVYFARFNTAGWSGELGSYPINSDGTINEEANWTTADTIDKMSDQDMSARVIYTYYDISNYSNDLNSAATDSKKHDGKGVTFRYDNLTSYQQADFKRGTDTSAQNYLNYIRGEHRHEIRNGGTLRDRKSRIGDIVNAAPVYVGKANMWDDHMKVGGVSYADFKETVKDRTPIVYVGANDGMLHGFNASDVESVMGYEELAFVPASVYSNDLSEGLHYYADKDYRHRFYVDLAPTYADAGVNGKWRSVIVGGNRAGGRSIFALDVTNPASFHNTDKAANKVVMWEFTHPDMGASYSRPQVAQLNNGRWAAIFGNGYNTNDNEGHDGKAKLFIVYLDADPSDGWQQGSGENADYLVLSTKNGESANNNVRNGLSTPRLYDLDGDSTADRVFAGDVMGNMWAWDLSSDDADDWGIAYKKDGKPQPLYTGNEKAPITTQPIILYNTDVDDDGDTTTKNLVVLFGTGQFVTGGDKTTTDTQHFLAVHDNGIGGIELDDLTPRTVSTQTDKRNITAGDKVDWQRTKGWALALPDERERLVVSPFVRRHVVFFNTSIPDNIPCSGGGSGWQMAVEALDGLDPTASAFDSNGDGVVDSEDAIYAGKHFDHGLPSETSTQGNNGYTPGSDGKLPEPDAMRSLSGATTRLSWTELLRKG